MYLDQTFNAMTVESNVITTQQPPSISNCRLHKNDTPISDAHDEESMIVKVNEKVLDQSANTSMPLLLAYGTDRSSLLSTNAIVCNAESSSQTQLNGMLFTMIHNYDDVEDVELCCAICHEDYKSSDRIVWSSNSQCTHVFHEECMVRWLISLGWIKSKEEPKVFLDENPIKNERNLLNYDLECPCCRQEFVDKTLLPVVVDAC
jgi:hypothetical protein